MHYHYHSPTNATDAIGYRTTKWKCGNGQASGGDEAIGRVTLAANK